MIAEYVPFVMGAVLVAATLLELRTGRIPNWLTLVPVALFAVLIAVAPDRGALLPQLYLALAVFAVGLLLFAFAGFGAGAVKLMAGTALFIPIGEAWSAFLIFILTLLGVSFVIIQLRKAIGSEDSKWYVWRAAVLPMSLPIAVAGLCSLFVY